MYSNTKDEFLPDEVLLNLYRFLPLKARAQLIGVCDYLNDKASIDWNWCVRAEYRGPDAKKHYLTNPRSRITIKDVVDIYSADGMSEELKSILNNHPELDFNQTIPEPGFKIGERTLLSLAIQNNCPENIIDFLIERGAKITFECICQSAAWPQLFEKIINLRPICFQDEATFNKINLEIAKFKERFNVSDAINRMVASFQPGYEPRNHSSLLSKEKEKNINYCLELLDNKREEYISKLIPKKAV